MHHRTPFALVAVVHLAIGTTGCKENQANAEPSAARTRAAPVSTPAPAPIHAAVATPPAEQSALTPESVRAIEGSCAKICERSAALHCGHPEACTPNCLAMSIGTPCVDEFAALYRCLEREPPSHWECAEDGLAAVRDGYCEKEQSAAVGCMEAKGQ